jgi:tetratricopeptide (TPR) repeat protein
LQHRLEQLDSLVDEHPDSVLRVLETLADSVDVQPESVRMRYALLNVKAEDKAYIFHTDDSLILSVAQYYERHTDERLTPEALYYVGRVHADMGDAPQALDDFQKALDACNSSDSDETKHISSVLHSQMGNLYSMQQQYTKSNANYKLAYHYDSLLNDTVGMIYDLRDYAHSFYYQMLFDSAQYYYREVDSLANLYGDERMKAMVVAQEAAIEVYVGNNERAIELIRSALPLIHENVRGGAYSTLADAFRNIGLLDSAAFYYDTTLALGNIYAKEAACKGLAETALSKGDIHTANHWLDQHIFYTDSLMKYMQIESIEQMSHLYDYQIRERENSRLQHENDLKHKQVLVLMFALLLVLFLAYIMYKSFKTKRIKQRLQYTQLKRLNEYQYRSSKERIEKLKKEITTLDSQLSDAKASNVSYQEEIDVRRAEILRLNQDLLKLRQHDYSQQTSVRQSDIYQLVRSTSRSGKTLTAVEWEMVEQLINSNYPHFLQSIYDICPLNDTERKVCMLLKLGLQSTEIAVVVCKEKSTVTKMRQRLYQKAFNTVGKASDWDDFILSL